MSHLQVRFNRTLELLTGQGSSIPTSSVGQRMRAVRSSAIAAPIGLRIESDLVILPHELAFAPGDGDLGAPGDGDLGQRPHVDDDLRALSTILCEK